MPVTIKTEHMKGVEKMYFKILKKDLKRKKTMNAILLIFIIMAGTFISSSVNNMISITTALDSFFEKAGLSDYIIISKGYDDIDAALTGILDENPLVESYTTDDALIASGEDFFLGNGENVVFSSSMSISSYNINQSKFFDENDNELSINDGEIYIPAIDMSKNNIKNGDKLTYTSGDLRKEFVVKGSFKDAFLGSQMMGIKRVLISDNDFTEIFSQPQGAELCLWSVNTSNLKQLTQEFYNSGISVMFSCDKSLIKTSYILDMLISGILIIVSGCLILISMAILRFTIVFTLQEEFREIGIMKAIGLKNRDIRRLYIVKYLAISIIGASIGFFLSIPFGNVFMKEISKNIVMAGNDFSFLINLICSAIIVLIVVMFSYSCTRKINKFSAIDAIRNGSNGERFKSKGILKLSKCGKIPTVLFMAINDILSGIRRFAVLIITFTLGIILVIVPVNTINTLADDSIVRLFGIAESDVYLASETAGIEFVSRGDKDFIEDSLKTVSDTLNANGINASVSTEVFLNTRISFYDNIVIVMGLQGIGTKTDDYDYLEGNPPLYENEVALTRQAADAIGAKIGDTVKIKTGEDEEDFIVTALYQSMNNMGMGMRLSEKTEFDYDIIQGCLAIQIKLNDNPNDDKKADIVEKIAELYPEYTIYNSSEYADSLMGGFTEPLKSVKQLILFMVIAINVLVTVLIVKSFITKEKGEIAMLKSVGFRNSSIIAWQTIRIAIVMMISSILGTLLSGPIAQISSGKIFAMMGASQIEFVIKPLEVYLIYPMIIFTLTVLASAITATQIKGISSQETNNIE